MSHGLMRRCSPVKRLYCKACTSLDAQPINANARRCVYERIRAEFLLAAAKYSADDCHRSGEALVNTTVDEILVSDGRARGGAIVGRHDARRGRRGLDRERSRNSLPSGGRRAARSISMSTISPPTVYWRASIAICRGHVSRPEKSRSCTEDSTVAVRIGSDERAELGGIRSVASTPERPGTTVAAQADVVHARPHGTTST